MRQRILIVEDSAAQAEALSSLLEGHGLGTVISGSAEEALEIVRLDVPDLVLADILLPGLDGFELCRRIKEELGAQRAPPVVLLTVLGDPADIVRGLAAGADGYVTKPYEPEHLIDRIRWTLATRERRRETDPGTAITLEAFGHTFTVHSGHEQILGLLLSSIEDVTRAHEALREREARLAESYDAEREARESTERAEEWLKAILESIADPFIVVDRDWRIRYVSRQLESWAGRPQADLLDESLWDAFPEIRGTRFQQEYESALARDGPAYFEEHYAPADQWLEVRAYPFAAGLAIHLRDVTGRKRADEERTRLHAREQEARARAEAAVHARDQVLRMLSHDLRNPLNTISMAAGLLRSVDLPPAQQERHLDVIQRTTEHMTRLLQGLLDAKTIEAGEPLTVETRPIDIAALLEEACTLFSAEADAKKLELRCAIPEPLPEVVADPDRILQVLWNLTGNAIKFTPSGGRVEIRAERAGDMVRVLVSDTGPGIDPADRGRLFEPFWQAEHATGMGAGLGLSISKAIVEAHGGSIDVDSSPGEGATFHFTLPITGAAP